MGQNELLYLEDKLKQLGGLEKLHGEQQNGQGEQYQLQLVGVRI